jgi:L,D-transpeptidase ErfK/SrfK/L,D-transpeptidase YbiS
MYDNDIEWLYNNIAVGTPIRILEQPIKMSYEQDGQKIELHSPLTPDGGAEVKLTMTDAIKQFVGGDEKILSKIGLLLDNPQGVVVSLN